ncbi:hypothetical protein MMC13_004158 [Lambiella insularis]|nr:hypothetical protein [Lambiella insularis]
MTKSAENGKVLIIGAGLAGLTLAQILFYNNIPFEIFERDTSPEGRNQGWAVALVECLPPMQELLPPATAKALITNSVNINTGDTDDLAFVDALTGERVKLIGGPLGQPNSLLRVRRLELRKYLWEANDLPISAGKHFTRYEEDKDGVTAFFKDGSSARGSILLGADGSHSRVLDNMIGHQHELELSKIVPIFGEVVLPPAQYQPLRDLASSVILAGAPDIHLQIGQLSMAKDRSSAQFFWILMSRREEPKELADWVSKAGRQEIYDFAIKATKHLHPAMSNLIRFGGVNSIVQPQPGFVEFVPPDTLPETRVSVLGDSGHTMIPFRGAGANTAILDACDLGRALIRARDEKRDPASVLSPYQKVMLPRGRYNVLSSRATGDVRENVPQTWAKLFERH